MAKILVVDDSRLTRRIIVGALEKAGHEVVQAGNGEEGLKTFHDENPDVVMTDLLMPVMDGFELTGELRLVAPDLPIIVTTADIQERSRERCEEQRVNRILTKPAKAEQILAALDEVMAGQEAAV